MTDPRPRAEAYIALGANLGDPIAQLDAALVAIAALPDTTLTARSRWYRTPPWGFVEQPPFVNGVCAVRTALSPDALIDALLRIERGLGRLRDASRWRARRIDLDLIAHGSARIEQPQLTLPHPHAHERAFVLVPLAEIAPTLELPGRGRVDALLATLPAADRAAIEALTAR